MSHQLAKLAATAHLTDGAVHTYYFAMTRCWRRRTPNVEFLAINTR